MLSLNNQILGSKTRKAIAFYFTYMVKTERSASLGFSLLESLIAVAVVSILIVSITPLVALSTSARVNARRIDQATQAARSYIDAVRGGVVPVTSFPNSLVVSTPNAQQQYTFESIAAPTTTSFPLTTICNNPTTANNVPSGRVPGICVDSNGNGFSTSDPQDLIIQPMRSGPPSSSASAATDLSNQGFWLAVRVYRADALAGSLSLQTGTGSSCAASDKPFSSSTSIVCPIVTMRSQIFLPRTTTVDLNNIRSGTGSTP
jgi:prepilin-type N-terminal cleavage/methylation domain-containing protein